MSNKATRQTACGAWVSAGMTPGKYETRARIPRSAAALICLISSHCTDKLQTLRGNQTHSHEQMYITLHTRMFMNICAVCSLQ